MKPINILMVIMISFFILITLAMAFHEQEQYYENKIKKLEDKAARCDMVEGYTEGGYLNGVYNPEGYYCVWTKGRNTSEIHKTECHEIQHALILENRGHFCE